MKQTNQFNVAIIGAGIAGSMLATILTHEGASVLLIDAATHPRFVIGESTVRHTLRMVRIMAEKYGIEELHKVGSGDDIRKNVTSQCGEKRHFGFIFHHENQPQNPREANQLVIPPFREGYEAHLFRQDIDAYLYQAALHYGTVGMQNTRVTDVDVTESGVIVKTDKGDTFTADYIVDAAGFRSPLAQKFNLRDDPPRARTHSRGLFTHMIDVKDYDEVSGNVHGQPEKWFNGTCHHIFDGGWLWVIPFNNHPESTNPLVSVGWQLDSRRFPKPTNMTPQEEWDMWLDRFPSIKAQFADAKVVRPWVSTGRIQYTAKKTVGDRWALLSHSAGFIDALYSRGLANTMDALNSLVTLLLEAIKDGDYRAERFEYLNTLQENNVKHSDLLVWASYVSWRDYDLWNAWFRMWALGVGLGDLRMASILRRYEKTHDPSLLPEKEPPMGLFYSNHVGFQNLLYKGLGIMEEVENGTKDTKTATREVLALIQSAPFTSPAIGLGDPEQRFINAGTLGSMVKSAYWALTAAPPEMKDWLLGAVVRSNRNKEAAAAALSS